MKLASLRKLVLPVLVTLSLGGLLTVLLLYSRSPDMGLAQRLQASLQDYELHDAELARDVLLARAGLLPNYDALAFDRQAVREALAEIAAAIAAATVDARRVLDGPAQDLARTHVARLAAVERFKSNNALLHNSLLYFAYVGPTLRMPLQGQALAAELGRLSYVVLSFMQSPSEELKQKILGLLDRIDTLGARSADLRSLVAHARLLVRVLPLVDAQLRAIHASPVADNVQSVRRAALLHDATLEARARTYRSGMYALAIGILLSLAWTWLRLRERARELRAAEQAAQEQAQRHRLQLVGANRLAVLGAHLTGVSHEIRNAIAVMDVPTRKATEVWPELRDALDRHAAHDPSFEPLGQPWPVARNWLERIHDSLPKGLDQLQALAGQLLAFGNPTPEQPVAFDLNASLQGTFRLLDYSISKRTRNFDFVPGEGLPPARGEPLALGLVVLNLINNSLDALHGPEGSVTVRTARAGDDQLAVTVEDDGCGIALEAMARLFEPFFTTKQGRGGTGLGLGMSRATLQAMGGELHIASEQGKGTCATALLRVARETP
jgi:signal transduction histidine kinase